MDGIFTAENLTKTFGSGKTAVTAVNDVSFALQKGQITTIVGESGSGKSTIARMVLGLLPITSGTMTFQGKDVTNPKGDDRAKYWRDVQAVFQDPFSAFNQFFTVKTLLYRSMRLLNESVGQDRLEEALGHVGMDLSVLDRYPAPAVRWSATAGDDRPGPDAAADPAGGRRGHVHARRVAAGEHPQRAHRPAGRART